MSTYGIWVRFSSDGDRASLDGVEEMSPSLALCQHGENVHVW